jgi:hypothetical protein
VPAGAPGSVPLIELAAVEGGYCGGQAGRDGVQVAAAACRGAALFLVTGQGQAAAGEEPAQGPPGGAAGRLAAVQELRWAGRGVGCQQPSGLAQDLDRAAWMMACRGEGGQVFPPVRDLAQPPGRRGGVAERPVRVGEAAAVAQAVRGVLPLLTAAGTGDDPGPPRESWRLQSLERMESCQWPRDIPVSCASAR